MQTQFEPVTFESAAVRMLLIFALALYLHWAAYWLIAGSENAEGPIGYLFGLELIVFFGHIPLAMFFLTLVFMAVNGFPAIMVFCALAPERLTPHSGLLTGLIVAVPLLLSTAAAYGVEAWIEKFHAAAPTQAIDLGALPADVKPRGFVALTGWLRPDDAAGYSFENTSKYGRVTKHSHVFVPVVAEGWARSSPVKYFVHFVGNGSESDARPVKRETIGQLSGHLPFYIQWQMKRKGLQIDPAYRVVEAVDSDGLGHRTDPGRRYLVLVCGSLVTVPAALCVCLLYALGGRSIRGKAAALR